MRDGSPRVAGVLVGDIERDREARIKLGLLFEALEARFPMAGVVNAELAGATRLAVALRSFRFDRTHWRRRFSKNAAAFRGRSRRAAAELATLDVRADVALQIGCMLDSRWRNHSLPSVIYTDYTARLSARHPEAGRSPLGPRHLARWIRLETDAYRRAAHVCTRSEFVRTNLITEYGLAPDFVTAIGGGVNFEPLPPVPVRDPSAAPTALFIGRRFHRKGGDVLLRSFGRARERVPRARLLLVTGDPIPSGLPLDGVTVMAPVWERERLSALYRQADLFVLPSRLETWGDVLLEAMAHGLPCLGTAEESMAEIISAGETGMLVAAADEDALTEALIDLLAARDRLERWGASARRRVEAEFTWERVVERLAPLLEAAASGGREGR